MTTSIFKTITKAPVPAYLNFCFSLEVDGTKAVSRPRFLLFDQDCLTYESLMESLHSMFPYSELTLTWKLGDEYIECLSDVELASKTRFDLTQNKDPLSFIVQAKGPRVSKAITFVKKWVDLNPDKREDLPVIPLNKAQNKEEEIITPVKKKGRFESPKDPFAALTSGQRQCLINELKMREPSAETIRSILTRADWKYYSCSDQPNTYNYYTPNFLPNKGNNDDNFFLSIPDVQLPQLIRRLIFL